MRHYLKSLIITAMVLYITYSLIPTINLGTDPKNVLIIIGGYWILSHIVNPIFSLVLLPLNFITFGLISFLFNLAFIFALLNFLPGFSIFPYTFPGLNYQGVILQSVKLALVPTIIATTATITILQKILHIVFE